MNEIVESGMKPSKPVEDCNSHSLKRQAKITSEFPKQHTNDSGNKDSKEDKQVSHRKPPFSYTELISMAIRDSREGSLTLKEIYQYIMDKFPYYEKSERNWQRSVRYNLSMNFSKVRRKGVDEWRDNYKVINPAAKNKFEVGNFTRRQRRKHPRRTAARLPSKYCCSNADSRPCNQAFHFHSWSAHAVCPPSLQEASMHSATYPYAFSTAVAPSQNWPSCLCSCVYVAGPPREEHFTSPLQSRPLPYIKHSIASILEK